ncbi:acyl-CoA dehydrogenase family protein [Pilimelia anulata]|uniref:acyl-CoA dehydrogenase family protein n=1 Tax=Pilimelia anulata TaxID=53371 RepID=UPI00166CBBE9|nr:acyl-CoA dehydrogenase family protein [Pilimelia anulata]
MERILPSDDARDLLDLATELADRELAPRAAEFEARGEFPREVLRTLGRSGLLGLPYPEADGGAGQPYEVYLQVLEILASRWLTVAEAISVHTLACFPIAGYGTAAQRELLPDLLAGERLGAYCLSEPQGGSDAAALTTRADRDADGYVLRGTKAWITHAHHADFYHVFARTGGPGSDGISCLYADVPAAGITPHKPERTMGLNGSPVSQISFDGARLPADAVIGGEEGIGFRIAMTALDSGRLGIAACAVGLAQAALDHAVAYTRERQQFGKPIASFQGLGFLMADLATQISAARALTLAAARLRDAGRPYSAEAAKAKLFATDTAMRVTTDAVQLLGGAGYVADHPVERYFREAKVLQIVEGTNQIQRLVIARQLTR